MIACLPAFAASVRRCTPRTLRCAGLGFTFLLSVAAGGRAQQGPIDVPTPKPLTTNIPDRADRLLGAGEVRTSLELLEARLASHPDDFEAQWRAARAAVYMGILATGTDIENAWYRRGVVHADRALALRPDDPDALRWAVASKGNLAVQTGAREAVRLTEEIWTLDHRLLEIDPDDALAHDALGSLNYQVMKLSSFERTMGRIFMGGNILAVANWADALKHLHRAVELDPGNILYRVDLADALTKLGRVDEATAQLDTAVALPKRLPVDDDFRGRAERRLEELRRKQGKRRASH